MTWERVTLHRAISSRSAPIARRNSACSSKSLNTKLFSSVGESASMSGGGDIPPSSQKTANSGILYRHPKSIRRTHKPDAHRSLARIFASVARTQRNQWLAEFESGTGHLENPLFLAHVTMPFGGFQTPAHRPTSPFVNGPASGTPHDSGRLWSASEALLSSGAAHDEVMATRDRRYPDLRRLVGCVAGFVSVSGCTSRAPSV